MKTLACKDLNPSTSCTYAVAGNSANTVAREMLTHAKLNHPEDIAKMDMSDGEIVKTFRGKVHN